jgi:hypothetical protein
VDLAGDGVGVGRDEGDRLDPLAPDLAPSPERRERERLAAVDAVDERLPGRLPRLAAFPLVIIRSWR